MFLDEAFPTLALAKFIAVVGDGTPGKELNKFVRRTTATNATPSYFGDASLDLRSVLPQTPSAEASNLFGGVGEKKLDTGAVSVSAQDSPPKRLGGHVHRESDRTQRDVT